MGVLYTVSAAWLRKRTLLIIYERDTPQHSDVIGQLTQLLKTQCNFRVVSEMNRHEQIRRNKQDFVVRSIKQADVVLVVVSDNLRAACLSDHHDNHLASVGELLLRRLREDIELRPSSRLKVVAARFDYTPAMTDEDTKLALVSEVYELMRDIHRLLFSLRAVNKSTQPLNPDCCQQVPPDDISVDVSKLSECVAVARQHYQQQQVAASTAGLASVDDDISLSSELTNLLHNNVETRVPYIGDTAVDNLASKLTSGYVTGQTDDLQSVQSSSESLYINERISQLNQEFDDQ